ncbi:hypothetical protein PQR15_29550 [Streptomyces lydicus]|nr:hypothetical protein [Streptomyces lydicus]
MKLAHRAVVALLGAAALGAAAPAAPARVEPDPVVAGQRVHLGDGGRCGAAGGARAVSTLFGPVALRPGAHGMAADVRVPERAAPGRHTVTIRCAAGGETFTETLTVRRGRVEGSTSRRRPAGWRCWCWPWARRTCSAAAVPSRSPDGPTADDGRTVDG